MKLIDILVAADFEWGEEYEFAAQDPDGEVWAYTDIPARRNPAEWIDLGECVELCRAELAEDWYIAIITRAEYLAARDAAKPKGHPHAALMAEYAEVARTNPEPWLEFHTRNPLSDAWLNIPGHPSWETNWEYRRKPRTIRIGEYDVPEPVREPLEHGRRYFAVVLRTDATVRKYVWMDDSFDSRLLKRGIVHLTREAAELHAKALLSFTQQ